jgi:hypothetical protein
VNDPEQSKQTDTPEGPEKDPQSYEISERDEGKQNALVHDGAAPDPVTDSDEVADAHADIRQPDGSRAPEAGD